MSGSGSRSSGRSNGETDGESSDDKCILLEYCVESGKMVGDYVEVFLQLGNPFQNLHEFGDVVRMAVAWLSRAWIFA